MFFTKWTSEMNVTFLCSKHLNFEAFNWKWEYLYWRSKGAGIFFGRGVPNLQEVGVDKTATPLLCQQKFYDPPSSIHLTPKQAKLIQVLKSVFLNKINTLSEVILWLPTFWSSKILWLPIFLSKNLWTPPVYLGSTPFRRNCQPPKL